MKILIVSQHYWPEPFRVTDMAESLVKEGHEVTALCGLPNYPQGHIYDGYKHGKNRVQNHNGVKIIRVKEFARRNNVFSRFLNYWSYPHYTIKYLKKHKIDCDVVLSIETSPIMMCRPAVFCKKKYNKPIIMYEMDLWPESLLAGGISNKSLIYKRYKKVSAKIYSQFDKILVSTKEHIQYIKNLPICDHLNIEYLPQYADTIFEESNFGNEDNGVIDLMFAGNIGKAQSVDTIIRTAALLKDDSKYKFHIVGSGSELDNIKKLAKSLDANNVIFYGQKPLEDMPELYKIADAMLVSLEDKPYANMTIPGKVQSYMAAGKPIIGSINGSCANFIANNKIGFVCPSNDSVALKELIKTLNIKELQEIGDYSKIVYLENYSKKIFIDKLILELEALVKKEWVHIGE